MEAIKPRSFKKMFERPTNKTNFLDNVTINNSSAINEMVKSSIEPTIEPDSNVNNIIEMRNEPITSEEEKSESNNIQEQVEIEKLKNDLFTAKSKYDNEHKTVEELNKQIEQLNQEITKITKNYNEETDTQAAAADELREKNNSLQTRCNELEKELIAQAADQADNLKIKESLSILQDELTRIKTEHENKCIENAELKKQYDLLEMEKNELEVQLVNNNDSLNEDSIAIDVEEDIIHGEVTSTMAENDRLSALNNELELQLINEIETRENAQMLYQELRSIMVSIGIEKNLEVFDQTKIELQQKSNIIAQQERLLNERDQYITSIQNSLMDGIGQMFLKRPTETVLALNQQHKEETVLPEKPAEVIKNKVEDISEAITADKTQVELLSCLVNQFNEIKINKVKEEENAIREQEEKYLQRLNENWIDIKQQIHALKTDGWSLEDISELLEVRIADLKKIINRRMPKGNRSA
ncbi:hypothetical protein [Acetobacterium wieringae]|uniref:hypothetical protein n=1 Tax=Acetobacterium wieringae TaxID=52694 RepID=UPI002B21D505|nr:hypothetical protein [Acetobacterium wieringae]MEA4805040.1 hypothetical protein [Acetobacterium wieringae]